MEETALCMQCILKPLIWCVKLLVNILLWCVAHVAKLHWTHLTAAEVTLCCEL